MKKIIFPTKPPVLLLILALMCILFTPAMSLAKDIWGVLIFLSPVLIYLFMVIEINVRNRYKQRHTQKEPYVIEETINKESYPEPTYTYCIKRLVGLFHRTWYEYVKEDDSFTTVAGFSTKKEAQEKIKELIHRKKNRGKKKVRILQETEK